MNFFIEDFVQQEKMESTGCSTPTQTHTRLNYLPHCQTAADFCRCTAESGQTAVLKLAFCTVQTSDVPLHPLSVNIKMQIIIRVL